MHVGPQRGSEKGREGAGGREAHKGRTSETDRRRAHRSMSSSDTPPAVQYSSQC